MTMDNIEHKNLEEWAKNYGGTAILGFICTLLIGGKFLHHMFQRRGLICGALIIPPAMMGGVFGMIFLLCHQVLTLNNNSRRLHFRLQL